MKEETGSRGEGSEVSKEEGRRAKGRKGRKSSLVRVQSKPRGRTG